MVVNIIDSENNFLSNESSAFAVWQKASVSPDLLISLGDAAQEKAQWDNALTYYKGAMAMGSLSPSEKITFRIGALV